MLHFLIVTTLITQISSQAFPFPTNNDFKCSDSRSNIDERCRNNGDCVSGLECINNLCQCRAGTYQVLRNLGPFGSQFFCNPAPGYRSSCSEICQEPLICTEDLTQFSGPKICQCPPGLIWEYGRCFKKCDENQFYAESIQDCKPFCGVNQIRIGDDCVNAANLGENCTASEECTTVFSFCNSGRCDCVQGFQPAGNYCISKNVWCPEGAPPMDESNNSIFCQKSIKLNAYNLDLIPQQTDSLLPPISAEDIRIVEDSCPNGLYCQIYSDSNSLPQNGHCCRVAELKCPIGLSSGSCSDCPQNTHYCYKQSLCCPKPCKGDDIFHNGQCFSPLSLNQQCSIDEQCSNHGGSCLQGVCQCGENREAKSRGPNKYCEIGCKPTEFKYQQLCVPRRNLGEECSGNFMCPVGGQCKLGRCQCRCGNELVVNRQYCAQAPTCPMSSGQRQTITNPTYCNLDANPLLVQPDNAVVETCASGSYCSFFANNLGICCPIQEPSCPFGVAPEELCQVGSGCAAENSFCHVFSSASPQSGVCCPQAFAGPTGRTDFLPESLRNMLMNVPPMRLTQVRQQNNS